jgi:c-di-GMP-binding flagellar brake protein YcgR
MQESRSESMTIEEKRRYPRLALGIEDGYFGNFKLANDESLVGPLVNISAGGLNLAAPEKAGHRIKVGDRLVMLSIAGGANFAFLRHIQAEIRWINKSETPGYLSVGLEFMEMAEDVREQLAKFVSSERTARGQYN